MIRQLIPSALFLLVAVPHLPAADALRASSRLATANAVTLRTNLTIAPTALRPDRFTLRLDPSLIQQSRLTAVSRDRVSGVKTTNKVDVASGALEMALPLNKQMFVFAETNAVSGKLAARKTEFPGTLVVRTEPNVVQQGKLFLEPRESPLPWDASSRDYRTRLVVGLRMVEGQPSVPLDPPVKVQFFAQHASIDPDFVDVTLSGTSGYQEVELICSRSSVEPNVTAQCDLGELTQAIPVEPLSAMAVVESVLPLRFLIVSLIGGAIGGLLRRNSRKDPSQRGSLVGAAVQGSVIALIVVSSLTAGLSLAVGLVDVVGVEVGAFAVACLAGFAGIVLLERLVKKTFGTDSDEGAADK